MDQKNCVNFMPQTHLPTPYFDFLAARIEEEDVTVEELVDFALAGLPEPFDPQGRLGPQERCLGNCLMDEGFQPTRVARLDAEEGGLWEVRIVDTPDLGAPAVARMLKRRLRRAITAASIAPVTALTEVYGRRGIRRFVFSTWIQPLEHQIVDAVDPD
jgi:hypothetical protein